MRTSGSHEISVSSYWRYKLPSVRNLGENNARNLRKLGSHRKLFCLGVSKTLGGENNILISEAFGSSR